LSELSRHSSQLRRAIAGARAPRAALLGLLGLTLCWLIITHSFVAYLSTTAPELALRLRGNDAGSFVALADREINPDARNRNDKSIVSRPTPKQLETLRAQVETALVADPLSPRAYRLLGQIAADEGSLQKAEKFMRAAARLSLHESLAVDWMMRRSFQLKNYPAAAYYADALLRSGIRYAGYATPLLARMAEDENGRREVEKLLAANPIWRRAFLGTLGGSITDARTPLNLFMSLRDTAAPPTPDELNAYQSFLIERKFYALAYYVWQQFLPPELVQSVGFLFNGDFNAKPSGSPFDWRSAAGVNVGVDFPLRAKGPSDYSLMIEFGPGRVEWSGVSQMLILPPGSYKFRGSLSGEVLGRRGVQWGLICMDGASVGQSEMILGAFPNWRIFEFSFKVPETSCPAQLLQLTLAARSPSERLLSGAIWFDDFSIARDMTRVEK